MRNADKSSKRPYEQPRVERLGNWQHLTQARPSRPGHSHDPKPIGPGRGR